MHCGLGGGVSGFGICGAAQSSIIKALKGINYLSSMRSVSFLNTYGYIEGVTQINVALGIRLQSSFFLNNIKPMKLNRNIYFKSRYDIIDAICLYF